MKKAIVTGANGFIGSNLVKYLLSQGVCVKAVVRNEKSYLGELSKLKNVDIIYCDLHEINSLPEKISDKGFDVFYHLAWDGNSGPKRQNYTMQMENVVGVANAFSVSESLKCQKFLCSGAITEKVAANLLNLPKAVAQNMIYGIAKNTAHYICEFLSRKSEVKFLWCTLSNIYGTGNRTGNIVNYTLDSLINNRIPEFSAAIQPFDLMFVDDCVTALYLLGIHDINKKEIYIGSGRPRLLKDYLLQIWEITGKKIPIGIGKKDDDGITYNMEWFNISDLTELTGFVPSIDFEDGIKRTIESMKKGM